MCIVEKQNLVENVEGQNVCSGTLIFPQKQVATIKTNPNTFVQ